MNSVRVLDVTLRDGGCVNNFNFGAEDMSEILSALEASGVEYIELGYIDDKAGSEYGRTQYINEQAIKHLLTEKKQGITYVAMMDYGKFDVDGLASRTDSDIDGIRLAFHKKNRKDIIAVGRTILNKGYKLFVQPMLGLHYTEREMLDLINDVNTCLPDASGFYIVDSFGEMHGEDIKRLLKLFDESLSPNMLIGLHSHNNLQLSYANALEMLKADVKHELMLDCSILGMGKGAGNLNTELLLQHLNTNGGKNYKLLPILSVIDRVLNRIRAEYYWGYAVEYYLSSAYHCTPSYASHFYNKHMLPIDQVAELLSKITPDKKNSFDKKYAEDLYLSYNSSKSVDDTKTVELLRGEFENKRVLLVAPGHSIIDAKEIIEAEQISPNTVTMALNCWDTIFPDRIFLTRHELLSDAVMSGIPLTVSSSIETDSAENISVIDYEKWVTVDGTVQDSSGIMALNILRSCGVSEILLAGFDGFSVNVTENYYSENMAHPVTIEQAQRRNEYFKQYIAELRKKIPVTYITRSLYE